MRRLVKKEYSCENAKNLFDCLLDGELTKKQACDLSAHLTSCEACRKALEERKKLKTVLKMGEQTVPPALHDAVMRRIHEEKRPFALPRLSRPVTALVGSLCAVALVFGVMLSPFGDMMKAGMTMEDADFAPSSAGKPNYSYKDDLDEHVPGIEEAVDKVESDATSQEIYTVKDSKITVALAGGNVARITDEIGKIQEGSYEWNGNTLTVCLDDNKALFTLTDDTLTLIEGSLFD